MDLVVKYDEMFFPDDRKTFIKNWIKQEKTIAIVVLDSEIQYCKTIEVQGSLAVR